MYASIINYYSLNGIKSSVNCIVICLNNSYLTFVKKVWDDAENTLLQQRKTVKNH